MKRGTGRVDYLQPLTIGALAVDAHLAAPAQDAQHLGSVAGAVAHIDRRVCFARDTVVACDLLLRRRLRGGVRRAILPAAAATAAECRCTVATTTSRTATTAASPPRTNGLRRTGVLVCLGGGLIALVSVSGSAARLAAHCSRTAARIVAESAIRPGHDHLPRQGPAVERGQRRRYRSCRRCSPPPAGEDGPPAARSRRLSPRGGPDSTGRESATTRLAPTASRCAVSQR